MSRGRTGNKIWQLITFSWHTLLWIVNGTSDLIGQLDSREPIILLWSTHVTTRSTSEIIQNLEEQHVIAKGTQMTKRIMVGGGKRRTEQVCCVSSDISWFYLCTNRIYLITQSIEKVMLVWTERNFEILDCCIPFYSSVSSGCDLNMPWGYFTAAYGNT